LSVAQSAVAAVASTTQFTHFYERAFEIRLCQRRMIADRAKVVDAVSGGFLGALYQVSFRLDRLCFAATNNYLFPAMWDGSVRRITIRPASCPFHEMARREG
jgi:hypothetical protein